MLNRRNVLFGATAAAAALSMPHLIRAQEVRKVRFAYGTSAIGMHALDVAIGNELGYYREEGLETEILSLGQTPLATLALDSGDTEFGVGTLSFQLPLFQRNELPPVINVQEMVYPYKYDVAVLIDSDIQTYADLKGKRIGVSSLGVTEYPATRALLSNMDIDPDVDVSWIAVGGGVAGGTALAQGAVDAFASFDSIFGSIEGAGIAFRTLPRPERVPNFGGNFVTVAKKFLAAEPETVVGFGRALRKSQEFIMASPAAACQVFVTMYPEMVPRGSTMEDAIKTLLPAAERRAPLFRPFMEGTVPGEMNLAEFEESADFLGLEIEGDMSSLFTNELVGQINDFDAEAIRAQAQSYQK
jgi:NitT/TauT family transport system substrate-binding protein